MESIHRDRTQEFIVLRRAAKAQSQWTGGPSAQDVAAIAAKEEDLRLQQGPPPSWMRAVESFIDIERGINSKMELLIASQREVFAPKFGVSEAEAEEQEESVIQYNGEVQKLLKEAERLATNVVTLRESASADEKQAAGNVQKHLSMRLANLLVAFRKSQSGYTSQLKQREERKAKFRRVPAQEADVHERLEREEKITGFLAQGYSEAECAELIFMEAQAKDRNSQIAKLAESVQEIHQMFSDLRDMVIEQGTYLDRIEYNIEKSHSSIEKGNVQLKKARDEQKKCVVS